MRHKPLTPIIGLKPKQLQYTCVTPCIRASHMSIYCEPVSMCNSKTSGGLEKIVRSAGRVGADQPGQREGKV